MEDESQARREFGRAHSGSSRGSSRDSKEASAHGKVATASHIKEMELKTSGNNEIYFNMTSKDDYV